MPISTRGRETMEQRLAFTAASLQVLQGRDHFVMKLSLQEDDQTSIVLKVCE